MKRQLLFIFAVVVFASCATLQNRMSKKEKFQEFQSMFTSASLPFELNGGKEPKPVADRYYRQIFGSKEFVPELKQSSFGRGVTSNCAYVASLYENDNFKTLCYLVANSFYDTLGERKYMMVTYKKSNGQIIDRLDFAGQVSPLSYTVGTYSAVNELSVSAYKNTWKNDPNADGYAGNTIIKTELVSTTSYRLDDKGHFKITSKVIADPKTATVNR
jgi:hypothetical protein